MIGKTSEVIEKMISYYNSDVRRINHFLKVHSFAKSIGELEKLNEEIQYILEIAAIVHDIGIKVSEQKYNSSAGNYQEIEGPPIAKNMLLQLDIDEDIIERVCYLVGHHHTYSTIDGMDYQILIESDFLVNIYEDNIKSEQIKLIKDKYFRTETGIKFLNNMYL
ncbi:MULTISPECIES: HD domain-containing protein [Clostridium]|uniref:HD domain-containing protein n=1 Tax=Clostridium cibarium TaxID=2762247 RepID=A0ABR8PUP1_9CLOT|nr:MULTISPECIES: HD domain-containing protein [Clostridium]MBD7911845.1 HD domain-containing protein [Clostridium cibarium]